MNTFDKLKTDFINFWISKGAIQIPGVSLVPNGDSTLLFVNSGMFPLVPYLLGQKHPQGNKLFNIQRCLRTEDLDDIGDTRHLTLFHMIGDWSLGDFFKKEQIPWVLDLYVNYFGLDINRIYVTVFEGEGDIPKDEESIELWKSAFLKFGIDAEYTSDIYKVKDTLENKGNFRIFSYPKKKNWWCRGEVEGEPGGPDSEIFYDMGKENEEYEEKLHVNGDNGRFVEIGNNVFMQYKFDQNKWIEMKSKNVDFGGGLDRIVMCVEDKGDIFETSLYLKVVEYIEKNCQRKYAENKKSFRIIADHIKASIYLIADGVRPSNKDQGYILRRIIRRIIVQGYLLEINQMFIKDIANIMIDLNISETQINENKDSIIQILLEEETKFYKTIANGIKEFDKFISTDHTDLSGQKLFYLFESFGFPYEQSIELLKQKNIKFDEPKLKSEFNEAKEKHSSLSRTNSEQKFKGGLSDNSEIVTTYHTLHHLVLAALKKVLSDNNIHQKGSNITSERLRIDFNYTDKLTNTQLYEVEKLVQSWIDAGLPVVRLEMPKSEAEKLNAEMEFGATYPEIVSVYKIGDISIEFCGGPHINNTSEMKKFGQFKILKEESSSAGIRRIKASLMK